MQQGLNDVQSALVLCQASEQARKQGAVLHPQNPVQVELVQRGFKAAATPK